jgi:hypothetical protein
MPHAQRQDAPIRVRRIPGARRRKVGKLDRDQVAVPLAFHDVRPCAVYDESAAEWRKGCVDTLEVFDNLSAHFNVVQMGNRIRSHVHSSMHE